MLLLLLAAATWLPRLLALTVAIVFERGGPVACSRVSRAQPRRDTFPAVSTRKAWQRTPLPRAQSISAPR